MGSGLAEAVEAKAEATPIAGVALVPDPQTRWRVDLVKARWRTDSNPIMDGCACPTCSAGYSRAYLHYLLRAGELTGLRLVTLHNLWFIARLMEDLRAGIDAGRLPEVAAALRGGAAPGSACKTHESPSERAALGT